MRRLAQLLDESDPYFMQGLMKADIYRQLGEFDNCLLILNRLNLPDHGKFIAQMREHVRRGINWFFVISISRLLRRVPFRRLGWEGTSIHSARK